MGANFRVKSEKALKIKFCIFEFCDSSPGAWHCTSDDVIDTHAQSCSRSFLLLLQRLGQIA